jgi:DNA-binding NarL/FixJ family response regulator
VNLLLVDDHAAYRQSLRIALSSKSGHRVVGEAGGAREGCRLIERCKPDLAIIDFFLGDSDGVSLARELRRRRCRTPILTPARGKVVVTLDRAPPPRHLRG